MKVFCKNKAVDLQQMQAVLNAVQDSITSSINQAVKDHGFLWSILKD